MQLVYFASPMCSWCWGFSSVIQQIKKHFAEQVEFRLVLAPLRVDTTEVMDDALRNYVLQQWHKVQQTTVQSFDFSFEMGDSFVYDTKPACRAIKSLCRQQPAHELSFLSAIQAAFYTKNSNITRENVLVELARCYKVDTALFVEDLYSSEIDKFLDEDFSYCQQLGVQGYPTLIGIQNGKLTMLVYGFLPYTSLESKVRKWVESN